MSNLSCGKSLMRGTGGFIRSSLQYKQSCKTFLISPRQTGIQIFLRTVVEILDCRAGTLEKDGQFCNRLFCIFRNFRTFLLLWALQKSNCGEIFILVMVVGYSSAVLSKGNYIISVPFYLWRIELILKTCKLPKYYD